MDIATFVGILAGFSLILTAIFQGGSMLLFVNIPGMMVVVGGTLSATLFNFPFGDIATAFKAMMIVFIDKEEKPEDVVKLMIRLAEVCRKKGIMALQDVRSNNQVLRKACQMIADGAEREMIANTLVIEIDALRARHYIPQEIFRKMGNISPAFGMLGTLIGLVQMLSNLENPETIGPSMAVALLTTFYGSLMATMFFLPLSGKLKARTAREVLILEIIFEGARSILESNNPLMVYEKLSSFLPPRTRQEVEEEIFKRSSATEKAE
ncbi:MAG: MotA/TolQ/ExbB proton channel family protein [Pseudomonadota bacterium]|nr:MotA/TolQ/ExbB proton channel family protein [Pseudomonadota bacterium]